MTNFETEQIRQNYELGVLAGIAQERARVLKLVDTHFGCNYVPEEGEPPCNCGGWIDCSAEDFTELLGGN